MTTNGQPGAAQDAPPFAQAVASILHDAPAQIEHAGLYCPREALSPAGFIACEQALLAHRSVRVFDFNMGRPEERAENVVAHENADPGAYRGVAHASGHRVFRADHHYPLRCLARESTTPLVLRWLRALHAAGEDARLEEIAAAAYLADHCDPDIVFAQHLGQRATDRRYLEGPIPVRLAAAARRNDFIEPPPGVLEPEASRLFYAGLGIEQAIERGELRFAEALAGPCHRFEAWLAGAAADAETRRLDRWEREAREAETRTLARIDGWFAEGRGVLAAGGAIVALAAPERIDNADLYLYLRKRPQRPRVQALHYPSPGGGRTWKLRSHGGLDLMPLFAYLNRRFPDAGFGGRAAAGGSRPGLDATPREVLTEIERWLEGEPQGPVAAPVGGPG